MVIPLWLKMLMKYCWVCSKRYPWPLLLVNSFLFTVLRVTKNSVLLLIF